MPTPNHGQIWTRASDGVEHMTLRPNVQMLQQDGTWAAGIVYMSYMDIVNGIPNATMYCETVATFQTSFNYVRG